MFIGPDQRHHPLALDVTWSHGGSSREFLKDTEVMENHLVLRLPLAFPDSSLSVRTKVKDMGNNKQPRVSWTPRVLKPFIHALLLNRAEPEWTQEEKSANGFEVGDQVL